MNLTSIFRFLPFLLLLVACNNNREFEEIYDSETGLTERIEYHPDGKVKARGLFKEGKEHGEFIHYDEFGNLEETSAYRDGVLEGILKVYYPNGKLKEETYYSEGVPVGWSYLYRENGEKKAAYQYIRFEDRYIATQRIKYNELGAIIVDSSHYMTVSSKHDTVSLGEELRLHFKLDAPFYGSKSQVRLNFGGFDETYRLIDPAATDTVNGNGLKAELVVLPKRKGKHVVRGRLEDFRVEQISAEEAKKRFKVEVENPEEIGNVTESVYIYFTKEFYVR
ncbi:hypothetical protein [uncultured Pontibacter sp.]|uniref:toxin-antitoxin system YwqK family antitoxin n=1 Tax=uncultured Pontibacter sp. TaxID=453356 RepID=UPI0026334E8C|nr:hypothetical protein [uncultured Pontibacter sp.]